MRRALEVARPTAHQGADADGVAASMLYMQQRNAKLEELRHDLTGYLRGGQDEQPHVRRLRDIDRLDAQAELASRV